MPELSAIVANIDDLNKILDAIYSVVPSVSKIDIQVKDKSDISAIDTVLNDLIQAGQLVLPEGAIYGSTDGKSFCTLSYVIAGITFTFTSPVAS
jgi:hypothetical protein